MKFQLHEAGPSKRVEDKEAVFSFSSHCCACAFPLVALFVVTDFSHFKALKLAYWSI